MAAYPNPTCPIYPILFLLCICSANILPRLTYPLSYRTGRYPRRYTNRVGCRYGRYAIPSPIPHFTPTTSDVITGMGVTQFLALYSHFTPSTMDVAFSDMPTWRSTPWTGRPPDGGSLSRGGIQVDSILILTSLSILPWPCPYRFGIHPNPTYTSYPIADHLVVNPMYWITAWCRRNWP